MTSLRDKAGFNPALRCWLSAVLDVLARFACNEGGGGGKSTAGFVLLFFFEPSLESGFRLRFRDNKSVGGGDSCRGVEDRKTSSSFLSISPSSDESDEL